MKWNWLLLAAAVVVLSNVLLLIGVARNRSGTPFETIELTERELALQSVPEDNSGIGLQIRWLPYRFGPDHESRIGREKLQELGFDCRIPAGSPPEERVLSPRHAYLALEYDGPARAAWLKAQEGPSKAAATNAPVPRYRTIWSETRLFYVDAARNAEALRRRYPDPQKYLIVHAVIAAGYYTGSNAGGEWRGWVSEIIPPEVHVPLPHAKLLSGLRPYGGGEPRYSVVLRYGHRLEPWVADVRMTEVKPR